MAFNPRALTAPALKSLVDNLARHVKAHPLPSTPKRAALQELVAGTLGWPSWHAAITAAKANANATPGGEPLSPDQLRARCREAAHVLFKLGVPPGLREIQDPTREEPIGARPRTQLPTLALRPTQPLGPVVWDLSDRLRAWLESRGGRPARIEDDATALTWEEVAAPDGLLAVWLYQVQLAGIMPAQLTMVLWWDEKSLCAFQPAMAMPPADRQPLLIACQKVWEAMEAQNRGSHVDLTGWYKAFRDALGAIQASCIA